MTSPETCRKCPRPLTDIDHHGKRLKGCIDCSAWINPDGIRLHLPTNAGIIHL